MKISHFVLFAGLAIAFCPVRAQTVDQVINKHIDAMGGMAKLRSLNSLYQEIVLSGTGVHSSMKYWQVKGRLWRMETMYGGAPPTVTVVTAKKGWFYDPFKETTAVMSDNELKVAQTQLSTSDELVDYAIKGNKVRLLSKDTVGKATCYRVHCTLPSGISLTYYIDEKSGYILRQITKGLTSSGADFELVVDYSDYRPESGYMLPHFWLEMSLKTKMKVTRVEVNKPIDVERLSRSK